MGNKYKKFAISKLKEYLPETSIKTIKDIVNFFYRPFRVIARIISTIIAHLLYLLIPKRIACNAKYFSLWERKSFHITPATFSWPIPVTKTLKNNLWSKQSELIGISINEQKQLDLINTFKQNYKSEYDNFPTSLIPNKPWRYYMKREGAFLSVDAEILYCMIRHFRPRLIFEVGSGDSTKISGQAIEVNKSVHNHEADLIAFEPYPNQILINGFPGLKKLEKTRIQDVDLNRFEALTENDILFIDSSHCLKIGSDVQFLYLEILPRLRKGVLVHIHDIFFPFEYPKKWILEWHTFPTEQYLLQAFLSFNSAFEVLLAGGYMHNEYPDVLASAFKSYDSSETLPGSFWVRKII